MSWAQTENWICISSRCLSNKRNHGHWVCVCVCACTIYHFRFEARKNVWVYIHLHEGKRVHDVSSKTVKNFHQKAIAFAITTWNKNPNESSKENKTKQRHRYRHWKPWLGDSMKIKERIISKCISCSIRIVHSQSMLTGMQEYFENLKSFTRTTKAGFILCVFGKNRYVYLNADETVPFCQTTTYFELFVCLFICLGLLCVFLVHWISVANR